MTIKQWQRRPSAFSRQALAAYAALVVYGSLYPFSGWRSLGLSPFAFLADPLPQYLTAFDVVTNVLGYMPLGALIVLALYPRFRGTLAVGAALAGGALLSGSMEAIQTYLPTRVASNLDLAANAFGALLGGVLIAPATSALLDRGLLRRIRFTWFERDAAYVIGLTALWPFAAMFPAPYLFGGGDLPRVLWDALDPAMQDAILAWTPASWDVESWPDRLGALLPDDAWEALITSTSLFAALVLATLLTRARAPRIRLMLGLVALTLFAKAGATFLQSRAGLTFDWATDGALEGIAVATLAGALAVSLPRGLRAALAGGALVVSLALVNLLPVNPYFDIVLADWRQGRYLHFNGLAHWLAWVWPYAALGWLASSAERALLARRRARKAAQR
ncbi:VanZ family protein [Burkholderia sp. YI23]|uniref:VanZ family protein n=1 Tax=unclassified Caballeronia TaxID=2646786 RepID=UPI0002388DF3|nr:MULTISPECIES: VanZ family protein [unclassified Caballeronia]AET87995.1 VanZ family protein [Burkholderia sp. YI23]MCE4543071.1 VanZ family protein [Caballeronia sp. PC1]MCE4567874.1 VanZ family protein [Caballeronia sp. CLC5]